jgi:phosphopantothenoylcysteine decarboxylase/phosphopantothenate--cysteine ligase
MLEACNSIFPNVDIAIMAAAVADYAPAEQYDKKIKREENGIECIKLVKNPDIAATLGKKKTASQKIIGFALETDNEHANALAKMKRKNLDGIVLNSLRDKGAGFGTDTNKITFIKADGNEVAFELKSKSDVAKDIFDIVKDL